MGDTAASRSDGDRQITLPDASLTIAYKPESGCCSRGSSGADGNVSDAPSSSAAPSSEYVSNLSCSCAPATTLAVNDRSSTHPVNPNPSTSTSMLVSNSRARRPIRDARTRAYLASSTENR